MVSVKGGSAKAPLSTSKDFVLLSIKACSIYFRVLNFLFTFSDSEPIRNIFTKRIMHSMSTEYKHLNAQVSQIGYT